MNMTRKDVAQRLTQCASELRASVNSATLAQLDQLVRDINSADTFEALAQQSTWATLEVTQQADEPMFPLEHGGHTYVIMRSGAVHRLSFGEPPEQEAWVWNPTTQRHANIPPLPGTVAALPPE